MGKNSKAASAPGAGAEENKVLGSEGPGMAGEGREEISSSIPAAESTETKIDLAAEQEKNRLEAERLKNEREELENARLQLEEEKKTIALRAEELEKRKGIITMEQAVSHVKENYTVPEGVRVILVLQDGNVFYDENISSGMNHAQRFGLLTFQLANGAE